MTRSGTGIAELIRRPVVVAPMGGGPSTPGLVAAAAQAGALGFLATVGRGADQVRQDMAAVRALTGEAFGVNLFVPGPPAGRPEDVRRYVASLAADAEALGAAPGDPSWDDDGWQDKVNALLADPPAVVSFTFGCPSREIVSAFQRAGSLVCVTVTSVAEARVAAAAGADCLCVQGADAGGHRGSFRNDDAPHLPLLALLPQVAAVGLPMIAAGGIVTPEAVAAALGAGAVAAQCGTAFLRCPESGAHPAHKDALADPRFTGTAVTRAFSGRPARSLVNGFMRAHPAAPAAFPEINNATRPLRAAAAARSDADRMSLWAGTGFRQAAARPAAEVIGLLDPRHPRA